MECPVCRNEFDEKTGRRPKKFCSDPCKVRFWNAKKKVAENNKPENKARIEEDRQIDFVAPTAEVFDGVKLNPLTMDEVGRFPIPKQPPAKEITERIEEILKGAKSEASKITEDMIDFGMAVYKTTTEGVKRLDPLGDEANIMKRIAELEKEIKNPPKNLQLGTRMYISVREKEIKELKSKLT